MIGTDGVTVWAVNDDCPGATDGSSCLAWTAPASGVYYVRISNRGGVVGCNTGYEVWIEARTPPVLIYLPLVTRNGTPGDLVEAVPPDLGRRASLGSGVAPGAAGAVEWVGSGSLLFALVGVQKVLNVRRGR